MLCVVKTKNLILLNEFMNFYIRFNIHLLPIRTNNKISANLFLLKIMAETG